MTEHHGNISQPEGGSLLGLESLWVVEEWTGVYREGWECVKEDLLSYVSMVAGTGENTGKGARGGK